MSTAKTGTEKGDGLTQLSKGFPCVGTVVWAQVEPWPYWPAVTVEREWALDQVSQEFVSSLPAPSEHNCVVQFFNYDDYIDVVDISCVREFCANICLLGKAGDHSEDIKRAAQEAIDWLHQQDQRNKSQLQAVRDSSFRSALDSFGLHLEDKPAINNDKDAILLQNSTKPAPALPSVDSQSSSDDSSTSKDDVQEIASLKTLMKSTKNVTDNISNHLSCSASDNSKSNALKNGLNVEKKPVLVDLNNMEGLDEGDGSMLDYGDPLPDADRAPLATDYQSLLSDNTKKNPPPILELPTDEPPRFKHQDAAPDFEKKQSTEDAKKEKHTPEKLDTTKRLSLMDKDIRAEEEEESEVDKSMQVGKKIKEGRSSSKKSGQSTSRMKRNSTTKKSDSKSITRQEKQPSKRADERIRRMREDARSDERPQKRRARSKIRPSSRMDGATINDVEWRTSETAKRAIPIQRASEVGLGGFDDEESQVVSEGNVNDILLRTGNHSINEEAKEVVKQSKELSQMLEALKADRLKFERKHKELISREDAIDRKLDALNKRLTELMKECNKN